MVRAFVEVDVFTAVPYQGNPVAVVLDAAGIDPEQMQRFANWANFSETTFVTAPTDPAADYAARIFTPTTELPFAGHPTLGTCHAWLEGGGVPGRPGRVTQQCAAGLVTIRRDGGRLAFAGPPLLREGPLDEVTLAAAAAALGLDARSVVASAWVDNGPGWLGLLLRSAEEVLAIRPRPTPLKIGVIGPHPPGSQYAFEVRAFFSDKGTTFEDPVTGSLNASAAQWLLEEGLANAPYIARQGTALGRHGVVHVDCDAQGQVWVGGDCVTCVNGTVEI